MAGAINRLGIWTLDYELYENFDSILDRIFFSNFVSQLIINNSRSSGLCVRLRQDMNQTYESYFLKRMRKYLVEIK